MSNQNYLGIPLSELEKAGGEHTGREIQQQPRLWQDTFDGLSGQQAALASFLANVYAEENLRIILSGAGTSAFIGDILRAPFQKNTGKNTWAIATTDLVSHPKLYFEREIPTLLVSFARSGNSPESIAAVNMANDICERIFHLIITCNPAGKLATQTHAEGTTHIIHMPPEADDKSLAMTGSFSCMLLTGLLLSRINQLDNLRSQVKRLAEYGRHIIDNYSGKLRELAKLDFNRAVFLGSGPLQGTARESQLKLQELTDGKVICKFDSFLGFRHGPKVVINSSTLMVYLFSNDDYALQYEADLVNAINAGEKGIAQIGISESASPELPLDLSITMAGDKGKIDEEFLSICSVIPAQMLGFFKSLELGLQPDSPSANKTITRVVEGVTIYPFSVPN
ncbi:MAG TPA: SIS domain-containing protein [Cyclobacteriaceae bacterium]|nr:SIS domain-containing protein [Cyclobacteriaceae bacterium]